MAKQPKSKTVTKDGAISLAVSEAMKADIIRAADEAKVTQSEWMRNVLAERLYGGTQAQALERLRDFAKVLGLPASVVK